MAENCGGTCTILPVKRGRQRADRVGASGRASRVADDAAFGIVGVALLAPAHREAVELARRPSRTARSWSPRRARSAGMPEASGSSVPAWPARLRREQALDHRDRVGRGHADRLVEHDPAVHVALLALVLLPCCAAAAPDWASAFGALIDLVAVFDSRSRWTSGVRSIFSIRSASSNRSSNAEANVRREFQVDAMRDLAAQELLVALERREHVLRVACRRAA